MDVVDSQPRPASSSSAHMPVPEHPTATQCSSISQAERPQPLSFLVCGSRLVRWHRHRCPPACSRWAGSHRYSVQRARPLLSQALPVLKPSPVHSSTQFPFHLVIVWPRGPRSGVPLSEEEPGRTICVAQSRRQFISPCTGRRHTRPRGACPEAWWAVVVVGWGRPILGFVALLFGRGGGRIGRVGQLGGGGELARSRG